MSALPRFDFDYKQCIVEIDQYKTFLDSQIDLSEKNDILPFFKSHLHLSAFIASVFPEISIFDCLKHEYSIYQDFKCDLAVGDSTRKTYCFIEFEDAKYNSIFIQRTRTSPDWSPRFEKGYSQIIDWFWRLEEMQSTGNYIRTFGEDSRYYGLLIIGRNNYMDAEKKARLQWRRKKVIVNSMLIYCLTFDDLYETLMDKIEPFRVLP